MQIFRNMDQPETGDIKQHPGYNQLPEAEQKKVDNRYSEVFNGSQRLGLTIAHGMAYQAAKNMCESFVAEKHIGFKKLAGELEGEGHSKESAGAIAHAIGVKKYGAKAMNKAAHTHKPLGEEEGEEEEGGSYCGEEETNEGIISGIKKVATAVNNTINPRRRKAQKIIKRVMGESEEDAEGIQKHNKEMKYCDACDGVHGKDEPCPGCEKPGTEPEDDKTEVKGGAGEILKTNHAAKKMSEAEKKEASIGYNDPEKDYEKNPKGASYDGGDSGGDAGGGVSEEEDDEEGGSYCGEDEIQEAGWGMASRERKRGPWFGIKQGDSKQKKALHHFKDDARYNYVKRSSRDREDAKAGEYEPNTTEQADPTISAAARYITSEVFRAGGVLPMASLKEEARKCEGCGKDLHPVGDHGYDVCMECTKARAKTVGNHGKCTCGKQRKERVMGNKIRKWIGCDRCLGSVKQLN